MTQTRKGINMLLACLAGLALLILIKQSAK